MQRIVLVGQTFSESNDFLYQRYVKEEVKKQWASAPLKTQLTVFVLFYLDPDAERRSLDRLLRPIFVGLRRTVFIHESQIAQLSACKVTRIPEREAARVEILIEEKTIPAIKP